MFMAFCARRSLGLRVAAGGLARLAVAGVVATLAASQLGPAWQPEAHFLTGKVGMMDALSSAALIGSVVLMSFTGTLLGLWFVARRPDGPERLVLRVGASMLNRMRLPCGSKAWS